MKNILNKLFSRLVIFGIIILLQFSWIVYTLFVSSEQYYIVDIFLKAISVLIALYVVHKDIRPYNKLSWVFLILLLPIIGCPSYFLFGRSNMTKRSRNRMYEVENMIAPLRIQSEEVKEELQAISSVASKQSNYIFNNASYPIYREDTSKYYKDGQSMFADMIEDLKNAKNFIFLEFFIMQPGFMFDSIVDILEQKAKEGVQIRLIYDDFGCIKNFPTKYYKVLQKKGIHCACFNPFRPFLSIIMNNRDHRKILVIDGTIAYTGGVNLADEYINKVQRFGYWKDAGVRLTGDCVWSFTTMFLEMWSYITRGKEDFTRFLVINNQNTDCRRSAKGYIQPYADCPLDKKYVSEAVYLNLINHAEKYVYIFTPYLIIGTELATALINSAESGVDVRIVTPEIPDKKLVYLLTQANYEPLIQGGVKIYQYKPGFIHSKCFVVDDEYASVGTINMDFRSLYLHFECGTLMYKAECVKQLKRDALNTFTECRQISQADCENKNVFIQVLLSILHLFAPLL